MNYITGSNRSQMEFSCLEELVEQENQVRFLEAFVDKLDLQVLQFKVKELKGEGRPRYEPKVFLKLYLYGYLNGIRSSRRLEKECKRNFELQWLLNRLAPNYQRILRTFENTTSIAHIRPLQILALRLAA